MRFRWFLDMATDGEVFVPTIFPHSRERLAQDGFIRSFVAVDG